MPQEAVQFPIPPHPFEKRVTAALEAFASRLRDKAPGQSSAAFVELRALLQSAEFQRECINLTHETAGLAFLLKVIIDALPSAIQEGPLHEIHIHMGFLIDAYQRKVPPLVRLQEIARIVFQVISENAEQAPAPAPVET